MTATTWMWMCICIATLILQFIFILILLHQSNRFKDTIDAIDPIDGSYKRNE
ncbi:hypothetical protein [Sporosarcina limicola]|uniref:Type VI protein secretion system component VasF n=1 Tax=Sporosarcina limicola TaxID=34101 RepID=A0A927MME1_9BACL|nr:hypothetical protein [Sporosarcina limicola]MBE1554154.1 type VI protein secretion system component VasF [Sporosarcina limicola]